VRESRGSKANDLAQTCGDRSADPRCAQRPTGLARADTGADASRSKHSVRPDYWIFSRARDFIAPDIATVVVPVCELGHSARGPRPRRVEVLGDFLVKKIARYPERGRRADSASIR
jgi:hypothetical protein